MGSQEPDMTEQLSFHPSMPPSIHLDAEACMLPHVK